MGGERVERAVNARGQPAGHTVKTTDAVMATLSCSNEPDWLDVNYCGAFISLILVIILFVFVKHCVIVTMAQTEGFS